MEVAQKERLEPTQARSMGTFGAPPHAQGHRLLISTYGERGQCLLGIRVCLLFSSVKAVSGSSA